MTTLSLGPADGTLTLRTGVEGRAARAGHALTIEMTTWSVELTLDRGVPTAVSLAVPWAGLAVVKGDGVLPLSPIDKRTIKSNALKTLKAAAHPQLTFTSTAVTPHALGYEVRGEVSLAGSVGPLGVAVEVTRDGDLVSCLAQFPFVQSAFGVTPTTAMLGALRVVDTVDVTVALAFST